MRLGKMEVEEGFQVGKKRKRKMRFDSVSGRLRCYARSNRSAQMSATPFAFKST